MEGEDGKSCKNMTKEEVEEEMRKVVDDLKQGMGEKKAKEESREGIGSSSVKAATLNMITQISFRVITFLLNAFVLRHISRDVMGLINVRLNLLDDTILFLSREAFRLACIGHRGKTGWMGVINLMWLSVPLSLLWSALLGWVWIHLLQGPPERLQQQYETAVYLVAISGVTQVFAEAPYLVAQVFLYVRLRVVMDFVWMFCRVLFLVYAVKFHEENVVFVWAVGHFTAGILYVLGYYIAFYLILKYQGASSRQQSCSHGTNALPFTSLRQLLPTFQNGALPVNQEYRQVAVSFMGQGVMKQILTEGERYLMTFLDLLSLSQQGIYDVVSNLGSLAARFVFRPVEESCYFFFSQQWQRGKSWEKQDPEMREKVRIGLERILRLMLLVGLVVLGFGFSYSDLLLRLYGGGAHLAVDGGTDLLRAQCLLISFLAVNGVTECFARSVMTEIEISAFNKQLVILSCAYLALTWALTQVLGPVGLVLANCANMAARVVFAVRVIQSTFSRVDPSPLRGLAPDNDILFIILTSSTCCQLSEQYLYQWSPLLHFIIGAALFLLVSVSVVVKEDFILAFIVQKYRSIAVKQKTQ